MIGFLGFSAIAVVRPMINVPVFEPEAEHITTRRFRPRRRMILESYPMICPGPSWLRRTEPFQSSSGSLSIESFIPR